MTTATVTTTKEVDPTTQAIERDMATLEIFEGVLDTKITLSKSTAVGLYQARVRLRKKVAEQRQTIKGLQREVAKKEHHIDLFGLIALVFIILAIVTAVYSGVVAEQVRQFNDQQIASLKLQLGEEPQYKEPAPEPDNFLRSYRI